jgi:hypothetical protein
MINGMRALTVWRIVILLATLLCVLMLFAPLVREMRLTVGRDMGEIMP